MMAQSIKSLCLERDQEKWSPVLRPTVL